MIFRKARSYDAQKISALYKSVIGSEFCTWNELYPSAEDILHDLEADSLFVLAEGEQLVGTVSVVSENEMDSMPCRKTADGMQRELARVAVGKSFQGRGLAAEMVSAVIDALKSEGCASVHIAVAARNIPALRTYEKLGFELVGETDMYDNHYRLLEKKLG